MKLYVMDDVDAKTKRVSVSRWCKDLYKLFPDRSYILRKNENNGEWTLDPNYCVWSSYKKGYQQGECSDDVNVLVKWKKLPTRTRIQQFNKYLLICGFAEAKFNDCVGVMDYCSWNAVRQRTREFFDVLMEPKITPECQKQLFGLNIF